MTDTFTTDYSFMTDSFMADDSSPIHHQKAFRKEAHACQQEPLRSGASRGHLGQLVRHFVCSTEGMPYMAK